MQESIVEYEDVLLRAKFKLPHDKVSIVMDMIRSKCFKPLSLGKIVSLPDSDDEPFLEVAITGKVDFIVTGNKKHFPTKSCMGMKVVNPREFLIRLAE
jgi:predicted nucleic acid-binding protein